MTALRDLDVVIISTDQISTDLSGETVILNIADGTYYGLNEVGSFVWQMLRQPRTIGELCGAVAEAYDVEPEVCRNDIVELIGELESRQLVAVCHETLH